MSQLLNANEIKAQASLPALLSRLGHEPSRKSGKELLYLSMLRDSDTNPSFCVNEELGVWFDHGLGKGGNVIDFGLAYWRGLSFTQVLYKISEVCQLDLALLQHNGPVERVSRPRKPIKIPYYKVEEIRELGNNDAITGYLNYRGVWGLKTNELKEVYYYVEDEKKRRKQFFSAGWQNENGGWEVRNKYFKGCIGPKGMTVIRQDCGHLSVFEGFMDYLSWRMENREVTDTVIVLNTLSFTQAAINRSLNFSEVNIYFDHNAAGRSATEVFLAANPMAKDRSEVYSGFEDYNDKIKAEVDALCRYNRPVSQLADQLFRQLAG